MRNLGVRFGAYHIYVPLLLKPAPAGLLALLWAVRNGGFDAPGLSELSHLAASGRTSVPLETSFPRALYRVVGYRIAGNRAVRIDILERLADLIRPLLSWRPTPEAVAPPVGAVPGGFTVTVGMTSLLGCAGEDFASVLRSLGYRLERRPKPVEAPPPAEAVAEAAATGPTENPTEAVAPSDPADTVAAQASEDPPAIEAGAAVEAAAVEAAPAIAEVPAEPAFIEVWRPGRHDRARPPRRDKRPNRPHAASRPNGSAEAGAAPVAAQPQEAATAVIEHTPGPVPDRPSRPRHDRHRDRQRKPEQPAKRAPERREKPIDPDSPFAALAALKARLEAKDGA
jgi:ATP-dependent RNA helicase SUPV3L1/SUV3